MDRREAEDPVRHWRREGQDEVTAEGREGSVAAEERLIGFENRCLAPEGRESEQEGEQD